MAQSRSSAILTGSRIFSVFLLATILPSTLSSVLPAQIAKVIPKNFVETLTHTDLNLDPQVVTEILEWEAPVNFTKRFPYSMTGMAGDDENVPVWVLSFGKWNVRRVLESGNKEEVELFEKYTRQMYYRWYDSVKGMDNETENSDGYILVNDLDGYSNHQLLHLPTLNKTLEMFRNFYAIERKMGPGLIKGTAVNANFSAKTLWTSVKSMMGELAVKFEVYGTNPRKWKPVLLKEIPRSALPKKLGGTSKQATTKFTRRNLRRS